MKQMKTSNKILIFIGLALLISPFINAFTLKQKLINKEFTLLKYLNKSEYEIVSNSPTDSIHIIGANNLVVEVIQSDSTCIKKEKNSNVYIYEENGVLTIQYSKKDNTDSEHPGLVTIKTPSIKAISFQGKLIVDSTGNKYKNTVTRYYSPFEVTIKDFKTDQINIHGLNGGGMINLSNNQLKSLFLDAGEASNIQIDNNSHFDSMKAQAAKNTSITFNGTYVNSLNTNLDPSVAITIIGGNVANITSYK